MKVQNISFGAKFIDNVNIERKVRGDKRINHEVALVELDGHSYNDLKSVEDIVFDWGGFSSFTFDICDNMHTIYENPPHINNSWYFYALTNQKGNYDKLDPKAILSIAQVTNTFNDRIKLNYFETNMKYAHDAKKSKFARIGTALMDGIKSLHSGQSIYAKVVDEAKPFYLKNGFEDLCDGFSTFVFKRKL